MLLYFPNEQHKHIVFFDTEFDNRKVAQVALILYEAVDVEETKVYLLKGSLNIYISQEVSIFFTNYTGITQSFLDIYGVSEEKAATLLNNFLEDLDIKETLFVAHGIKQDMDLLLMLGVNVEHVERYCTYNAAKRLLGRETNLTLLDVCNESGYYADQHDAYTDAKNVVHAFSFLKLVEATKM